jgi:photosystem II stability/assembly factor-like uncharacterized protein
MSDTFYEDMGRKARWFYGGRGYLSDEVLNRRWHDAIAHTAQLRAARAITGDPGGGAIKRPFTTPGAGARVSAHEVDNPDPTATGSFATVCVEVVGADPVSPVALKLRPLRGSNTRLDLRTATVFRFDPQRRQWDLMETSAYNARSRYVWVLAPEDGVYVAVALPRGGDAVRGLALERFAYYYVALGVGSGLFTQASDYFTTTDFRRLVSLEHDLSGSAAGRALLRDLVALHTETRSLRTSWRGQLPAGGLLEWRLMDHLAEFSPGLLASISDIVHRFPWIIGLSQRVARWYPAGPYNINGRVKSLAIHPSDNDVVYAGAANGGVWKTTDGGDTWRSLWTTESTMAVSGLAVSRSSPNWVYACTGEDTPGYGNSYGGSGVFRSTDGGSTWLQRSPAFVTGARCTRILVHPTDRNRVWLASTNGVLTSSDGGASWTVSLPGHASDLEMASDNPQHLWAGMASDGVYRSTDGGATWARIEVQIRIFFGITIPFPTGGAAGWPKLAVGVRGPNGSNFVIAKLGDKGATTLGTVDGGNTWAFLGGSEGVDYDEWTSFVAIHPHRHDLIFLGGLNLQRAEDGHTFASTTGTHSDHHQIVFDELENNGRCWVCCDGGVYRSEDHGATWALSSTYLQATQLISFDVSQTGLSVIGGATQDQGIIQTDNSLDWNDYGGGNEWGMFVVDPDDSSHVYISPGDGYLRTSSDGGHSWSDPSGGLTHFWTSQNRQTRRATFAHVAVRPGQHNEVIGACQFFEEVKDSDGNVTDTYGPMNWVMFSSDFGQNWTLSLSMTDVPARVAFAPSNNRRAYAASNTGAFYRSTTGGDGGWTRPGTGATRPPSGNVSAITVDPVNADRVYLTYTDHQPHVWRSTDGGTSWVGIDGTDPTRSLPNIAASDLVVDSENSNVLYVATDVGVFRTNNGGYSWFPYNDGPDDNDLPVVLVTGLAQRRATHELYASTMGRGAWSTTTSGLPVLQVIAVSYLYRNRLQRGIVNLRLTDGATTYVMSRFEVIRRIEAGTYVYTIGSDGSRAVVRVMQPDGSSHPQQYLMTAPDSTTADNLMSLPRF